MSRKTRTTASTPADPDPEDSQAVSPSRVGINRVVADSLGHPRPTDRESATIRGRDLLDRVLGDLSELGVDTPHGVQAVLQLWDETMTHLSNRKTFADWLSMQILTDLTPQTISDGMRETGTARDPELVHSLEAELLDRALDALAEAADEITAQLRPAWEPLATVVADAVAVGINERTRAEVAIADDSLVEAWRSVIRVVPTLDRIHATYYRLLFVAGYELAPGEQAIGGGAEWMRASADGAVQLVAPSKRKVPVRDADRNHGGRDGRSGTAAQIQAEIEADRDVKSVEWWASTGDTRGQSDAEELLRVHTALGGARNPIPVVVP